MTLVDISEIVNISPRCLTSGLCPPESSAETLN